MGVLVHQIALVLLPIFLGFGLRSARVFNTADATALRRLVMRLAVPLLAFFSGYDAETSELVILPWMLIAAVLVTAGRFLVGGVAALAVKGAARRTAVQASTALGNYGWLGIGVSQAVLGEPGLRLAVFFVMAWWPVFFGVGFGAAAIQHGTRGPGIRRKEVLPLALPVFICLGLGLLANLGGFRLPALLEDSLRPFAGMTVPLILLSSGVSLNLKGCRTAFAPALLIAGVALLIGPMVGWLVASVLPVSATARQVIILEAAMPVAVMAPLLADHMNMDRELSESAVVVSTLLAFVTLPILLLIMQG